MPQTATITALLALGPLYLDCIALKAGVGPATTEVVLARIRDVLGLQRDESGHCRACGTIGVVFSLARSTPRRPTPI
jgi:hypothetical protein